MKVIKVIFAVLFLLAGLGFSGIISLNGLPMIAVVLAFSVIAMFIILIS